MLQDSANNGTSTIEVHLGGNADNTPTVPRFDQVYVRSRKLTKLLPQITGLLSFVGSCYIVYSIVGTRRGRIIKLKSTFNRLLVGLSVCDIISSFAITMSHWAFPSEEWDPNLDPEWYDASFPGASGSKATCSMQVRRGKLVFRSGSRFSNKATTSPNFVLRDRDFWYKLVK